jgi:hypothetical protein
MCPRGLQSAGEKFCASQLLPNVYIWELYKELQVKEKKAVRTMYFSAL